jgi:hypothetical protein
LKRQSASNSQKNSPGESFIQGNAKYYARDTHRSTLHKKGRSHTLTPCSEGPRPPRLRRVVVRGGGEEPRRGRGGERSGSDHHQTYRATRAGHPPNNTHPDQPPHSTPPYSDRDPTHPGLSQYSTLGTAQRRPIGRGSCFYGGECTMERSSSSRNCTRERATWSSVLLGARKWIQKKKIIIHKQIVLAKFGSEPWSKPEPDQTSVAVAQATCFF